MMFPTTIRSGPTARAPFFAYVMLLPAVNCMRNTAFSLAPHSKIQPFIAKHQKLPTATGRDLVHSEIWEPCSDEQRLFIFDPTISTCNSISIEWDKDGILSASGLSTIGTIEFLGSTIPNVITVYSASYNPPGFDSVGFCNEFDSCVRIADFERLPGQFTYDCSNVYCGPNAKRSCNGQYEYVPCRENIEEASLVDIPTLRDVNCQKVEDIFAQLPPGGDITCGPCMDADNDTRSISCDPYCGACDGNGLCTTVTERLAFGEQGRVDGICVSYKENVYCQANSHPPTPGDYAKIEFFDCSSELNGSPCSCSICGIKEDALLGALESYTSSDLLYEVDCTAVDGISRRNQCTNTATGALDFPELPCSAVPGPPPSPGPQVTIPLTMLTAPPVAATTSPPVGSTTAMPAASVATAPPTVVFPAPVTGSPVAAPATAATSSPVSKFPVLAPPVEPPTFPPTNTFVPPTNTFVSTPVQQPVASPVGTSIVLPPAVSPNAAPVAWSPVSPVDAVGDPSGVLGNRAVSGARAEATIWAAVLATLAAGVFLP